MSISNEEIILQIREAQRQNDSFSCNVLISQLWTQNMTLIKQFCKPYTAFEPEEDILQVAYFGFDNALKHYDDTQGIKFMTYAQKPIKQACYSYICSCGALRLPPEIRKEIARYRKNVDELTQELQREPTDKEIAKRMNVSINLLPQLRQYMQGVISLDSPISDDSELTISDTLESHTDIENEIVDKMYDEHMKNELWGIIEAYTSNRENFIIQQHYKQGRTLKDISQELDISPQRAQQMEHESFLKLRTKARRALRKQFVITESMLFHTSLGIFKTSGSGAPERIAIRNVMSEEAYFYKTSI